MHALVHSHFQCVTCANNVVSQLISELQTSTSNSWAWRTHCLWLRKLLVVIIKIFHRICKENLHTLIVSKWTHQNLLHKLNMQMHSSSTTKPSRYCYEHHMNKLSPHFTLGSSMMTYCISTACPTTISRHTLRLAKSRVSCCQTNLQSPLTNTNSTCCGNLLWEWTRHWPWAMLDTQQPNVSWSVQSCSRACISVSFGPL